MLATDGVIILKTNADDPKYLVALIAPLASLCNRLHRATLTKRMSRRITAASVSEPWQALELGPQRQ